MATRDPMTGAFNRRSFFAEAEKTLVEHRASKRPLCAIMSDIDHFKRFNDLHGHEVGDLVIIAFAKALGVGLRTEDRLCRYGGEEFVILMPDTELASGIEAMTRLQRELTRIFFLSGKENVLITFSAGVVQVEPDETGVQVLNRADQAMYLAKRAGKNRVMGG